MARELARQDDPDVQAAEAEQRRRIAARARQLTSHDGEVARTLAASLVVCDQCHGAGFVRVARFGADTEWITHIEPCGCQTEALGRARWQRALAASDMSDELRAMRFADYDASDNPRALEVMQAWSSDPDGWVLLYGGWGTGKTRLLASAFNVLMTANDTASLAGQRHYPLYVVVPSMLDHIRRGLNEPNSREYGARFDAIQQTPILLLDDLGAEKHSEWTDELLFKLLDYRYRQQLPTAVASNVDPVDLEPRIASRLRDAALSQVVLMAGADYRLKARGRGKAGR